MVNKTQWDESMVNNLVLTTNDKFCQSHEVTREPSCSPGFMTGFVNLAKSRANHLVLLVLWQVLLISRTYVRIILFSRPDDMLRQSNRVIETTHTQIRENKFLPIGLINSIIPQTGATDGFPGLPPDSAADGDPRVSATWLGNRRRPEGVGCLTRQQTGTQGDLLPDSAADGDPRASAAWLGNRRGPEGVCCLTRQQTGTRGRRLPELDSIKHQLLFCDDWFLVNLFGQQPAP